MRKLEGRLVPSRPGLENRPIQLLQTSNKPLALLNSQATVKRHSLFFPGKFLGPAGFVFRDSWRILIVSQ